MPEGSNIGNLYYTVSIDRASLEKVRRDLRALGEAAEKSAPGVTKIERAMERLGEASKKTSGASRESGDRFKNLVGDLRVLESSVQDTVNMFRSGRMTVEQFTSEMTVFGQLAEGMRSDLMELGQSAEGASIDQEKMSRALRDTSSVMDNVRQKTEKLGVEYKDVESRFETLTARAKELRRDLSTVISRKDITEPEEYAESLKIIDFRAEALNSELDELRGTMGRTAEGSARISGRTAELANTQAKARKEFGLTRGAIESASASVSELEAGYMRMSASAEELTAEIRSVSSALDTSSGNTEENRKRLQNLLKSLRDVQILMDEYSLNTQMSTQALKRHHSQTLKMNSALRKAERSLEKNTGAMSKQAMAANLSYGGLSLLQDRIFQISPALGIFTNQLMFTERGLRAMLATMAPVLAVAGSLIAVFGTLAASVKAGSELETALANVRKTTNLSSDALYGLTQSFQETSKEIPVTVQELLEMAQVAGQLGITGAENVERFSDTVARLSVATDVTGEQGATNLARFLQATGTAMDDMGTEAERVANVLNQLENTTAATAAEILQMTSYTQGLSSQAGFTTDEILALNSSLLALGVKAEAGGSAVVRTMAKIQEAASAGSSELVAFAENADMTTEEFGELVDNSPLDALVALADGMAATSDAGGNLNDVLNELNINEVRERRTLLALAQGHETLKGAIEEARRESFLMNSLNKEVQIQSETLAAQVQLLKNRFIEIAQDLGNRTVPVVKALNGALINLVDTMRVLTPLIVGFGAALGARALIFGIQKVVAGIGAMTAAAGAAKGAMAGLAAAMKVAMGPMGWVSLGIGVVAGGISVFNNFRNSVDDASDSALQSSRAFSRMADEFARVEDEADLTYALEATAGMLEGRAKEAWDNYVIEIQEAIDKGEDLQGVIDGTIEKLGQLGRAPLFQDFVGSAIEAQYAVEDLNEKLDEPLSISITPETQPSEILAASDEVESAFTEALMGLGDEAKEAIENALGDIEDISTDEFLSVFPDGEDFQRFFAGRVPEGLYETIEGYQSLSVALDEAFEARKALDQFEARSPFFGDDAAGAPSEGAIGETGGGAAGGATGGGRAPSEFDPIADIIERREDEIDRLQILINKYGRDTAFAFTQGLIDAQEEAGNAFVDFVSSVADRDLEISDGEWVEKLIPKESFIQQIQEAGGTDEAGNFLVSTAEATEKAMEMIEKASDLASSSFQVMDIRISDLAAGMDRFVSQGLEGVEEAFEEGIIGPIGRAERRVEFHRQLFNTLSSQYGEFSEAAQIVKGRLEEEEATLASLTATEQERQETQREMTQQQEAVAQAVSDRIVAEVSLGRQLSNNNISQEEYYRQLIEVKQAELDAKVAKNGVTQETIELEAEIINLNNALDEEISRQEELRQAMDDTAAARQSSAEVTRDYHTELSRGASVGTDVATARGEQLATQMDLNELLEFGVITQGQYNKRLLQSKQRLLEYAVQNGVTAEWVVKLKMEVDNLTQSMEENSAAADESTGVFSELADGFRDLADAAEAAGNEAGASFLNFLGSLSEQAPNVVSGINEMRDGIKEYDSSVGMMAEGNKGAMNSIMSGISGVASAISALVPQQNSAANSMVEGFFSVGGSIAELVTGIPGLGKAMGAVGKVVSGVLGDMSNGAKQVTKSLEEMAESMQYVTKETAKGFRDIEGATKRVSRGNILGWLGFTKEAIDEEIMGIIQNVASGISEGLGDALKAGFRAALTGEGDWKKEFRDRLEDAMLNLVIDTLVNSAILAEDGPFQEFIAEFTRIMAEEGPAAAFAYANKELPGLMSETEDIIEKGAEGIPDMFKIGSDAVIESTQDNIDRLTEHIQDTYSYMTDAATKSLIKVATTGDEINQEMLNNMLNMADSIMSGIQGAMKKGMRSAMAGEQDWKKELKSGVLSAIGDTVMDAFIKQAIIQGIMADFVAGFVAEWEKGDYEAANQYIRDNLDSTIDRVGDVIDTFINAIPPELRDDFMGGDDNEPTSAPEPAPSPDSGAPRDAGTRISEITGPTRDLLLDLLRPLSILPSWTSMIRDIRNDVRAIAADRGISVTPDVITTPESIGTITNVENQTINITNPTITTQARSIKELYRELSEYASKQKKGGRK